MTIKELLHLPAAKLKRVVALKGEIERLEAQLENVIVAATPSSVVKVVRAGRKMSAAARKKISQAAKARWAKVHSAAKAPKKGKRTMSAAARRKIAAAAKARWAKVKAAGKKRL